MGIGKVIRLHNHDCRNRQNRDVAGDVGSAQRCLQRNALGTRHYRGRDGERSAIGTLGNGYRGGGDGLGVTAGDGDHHAADIARVVRNRDPAGYGLATDLSQRKGQRAHRHYRSRAQRYRTGYRPAIERSRHRNRSGYRHRARSGVERQVGITRRKGDRSRKRDQRTGRRHRHRRSARLRRNGQVDGTDGGKSAFYRVHADGAYVYYRSYGHAALSAGEAGSGVKLHEAGYLQTGAARSEGKAGTGLTFSKEHAGGRRQQSGVAGNQIERSAAGRSRAAQAYCCRGNGAGRHVRGGECNRRQRTWRNRARREHHCYRIRRDCQPRGRRVVGIPHNVAQSINAGGNRMGVSRRQELIQIHHRVGRSGPDQSVPDRADRAHFSDPAVTHLLRGGQRRNTAVAVARRIEIGKTRGCARPQGGVL